MVSNPSDRYKLSAIGLECRTANRYPNELASRRAIRVSVPARPSLRASGLVTTAQMPADLAPRYNATFDTGLSARHACRMSALEPLWPKRNPYPWPKIDQASQRFSSSSRIRPSLSEMSTLSIYPPQHTNAPTYSTPLMFTLSIFPPFPPHHLSKLPSLVSYLLWRPQLSFPGKLQPSPQRFRTL